MSASPRGNLRLTAIHSLLAYASYRCPEHAETIRVVLEIPPKTRYRAVVTFLTWPETTARPAWPSAPPPLASATTPSCLWRSRPGFESRS